MITKYRASMGHIQKVEVIRETEKMVVVNGSRKEHKTTEWFCYRDTFDEAKQWIVDKRKAEMERAKRELEYREVQLNKALEIKE